MIKNNTNERISGVFSTIIMFDNTTSQAQLLTIEQRGTIE